jgi:hypothetical protein
VNLQLAQAAWPRVAAAHLQLVAAAVVVGARSRVAAVAQVVAARVAARVEVVLVVLPVASPT